MGKLSLHCACVVKQYNLVSTMGQCSAVAKVTAGLVKSNGSLRL